MENKSINLTTCITPCIYIKCARYRSNETLNRTALLRQCIIQNARCLLQFPRQYSRNYPVNLLIYSVSHSKVNRIIAQNYNGLQYKCLHAQYNKKVEHFALTLIFVSNSILNSYCVIVYSPLIYY